VERHVYPQIVDSERLAL